MPGRLKVTIIQAPAYYLSEWLYYVQTFDGKTSSMKPTGAVRDSQSCFSGEESPYILHLYFTIQHLHMSLWFWTKQGRMYLSPETEREREEWFALEPIYFQSMWCFPFTTWSPHTLSKILLWIQFCLLILKESKERRWQFFSLQSFRG